ncbi:MAG: Fe-S cluster assembly protein IscX [Phycisphaeraceae bacterium]|nr:Fe-S cluster assembly protein IscX [Phycisphaeraceae bacterium]
MPQKIHWLDVDEIAERLLEKYPDRDPLSVRFTELRQMVESLHDFEAQPKHPVNEKILETIQSRWYEEKLDAGDGEDEDE